MRIKKNRLLLLLLHILLPFFLNGQVTIDVPLSRGDTTSLIATQQYVQDNAVVGTGDGKGVFDLTLIGDTLQLQTIDTTLFKVGFTQLLSNFIGSTETLFVTGTTGGPYLNISQLDTLLIDEQTLSISNDTLSITGGNSVVLPSSGGSGSPSLLDTLPFGDVRIDSANQFTLIAGGGYEIENEWGLTSNAFTLMNTNIDIGASNDILLTVKNHIYLSAFSDDSYTNDIYVEISHDRINEDLTNNTSSTHYTRNITTSQAYQSLFEGGQNQSGLVSDFQQNPRSFLFDFPQHDVDLTLDTFKLRANLNNSGTYLEARNDGEFWWSANSGNLGFRFDDDGSDDWGLRWYVENDAQSDLAFYDFDIQGMNVLIDDGVINFDGYVAGDTDEFTVNDLFYPVDNPANDAVWKTDNAGGGSWKSISDLEQTLSISNDTLSISGGNSVTLPSTPDSILVNWPDQAITLTAADTIDFQNRGGGGFNINVNAQSTTTLVFLNPIIGAIYDLWFNSGSNALTINWPSGTLDKNNSAKGSSSLDASTGIHYIIKYDGTNYLLINE